MKLLSAVAHVTVAVALMAAAASVGAQQDYPNKPIRFITPYAAGGSTSFLARLVGQKLTERWGQQVLIESRGSASLARATNSALQKMVGWLGRCAVNVQL